MQLRIALTILVIGLLFAAHTAFAQSAADSKVALVLGNSAYDQDRIKSATAEVRAVSRKLGKLGFAVIRRTNQTKKQMEQALVEFGRKIRSGTTTFFYFAGHSLQVNGKNYLVPLGIDPHGAVESEFIDLDFILTLLARAGSTTNVVVINAAYPSPAMAVIKGAKLGLAEVKARPRTILSFPAQPGQVAAEDSGRYSLFAKKLISLLTEPGLTLEDIFSKIAKQVETATNGAQKPWIASGLESGTRLGSESTTVMVQASKPNPTSTLPAPTTTGPSPTTTVLTTTTTIVSTTTTTLPPPTTTARPRSRPMRSKDTGQVKVASNVAGAAFTLAGKSMATVARGALLFSEVPPDTYRLKATKKGYRDWSSEVKVLPGETTLVYIEMIPLAAETEEVETVVLNTKPKPKPRPASPTTLAKPPEEKKDFFDREYRTNMGHVRLRFQGDKVTGTVDLTRAMTFDWGAQPGPERFAHINGDLKGREARGMVVDEQNQRATFYMKFSDDFRKFKGSWNNDADEGYWGN